MFVQSLSRLAFLQTLALYVEQSTVPLLNVLFNDIFSMQNIYTFDFKINNWSTLGCANSILTATGPTLHILKLQIDIYNRFLNSPDFELIPALR